MGFFKEFLKDAFKPEEIMWDENDEENVIECSDGLDLAVIFAAAAVGYGVSKLAEPILDKGITIGQEIGYAEGMKDGNEKLNEIENKLKNKQKEVERYKEKVRSALNE